MKLASLKVSPYRGAPERRLDMTGPNGEPHPLVAITGAPGVGKTTLLELMCRHKEHVAPYGRPTSLRDVLADEQGRLEVSTEWLLDEKEQQETGSADKRLTALSIWERARSQAHADPALVHVLSRYRHDTAWGKVDYAPASRVAPPGMGSPGDPVAWQQKRRLAVTNDKYAGLGRLYLAASESAREDVATLLLALRPNLHAKVDTDGKLRFETPLGPRHGNQLSLSQRLAFQIAATFVLVGLHHSVVLIDTPELGLPGGEALTMLRALRAYAPTTQLIVTTTDPGILSSNEAALFHLEQP